VSALLAISAVCGTRATIIIAIPIEKIAPNTRASAPTARRSRSREVVQPSNLRLAVQFLASKPFVQGGSILKHFWRHRRASHGYPQSSGLHGNAASMRAVPGFANRGFAVHMPEPGVSGARAGWQVRLPMTFSSAQLRLSKSADPL
jgi:hypothetical protein